MDPLSVGASVIAVVGATGKVIKGIRGLKAMQDAPKELDDLLMEVSQFELVVQASQRVTGNIESELRSLLKIAQDLVTEFESLVEYRLTEPGTSNKVDRWRWIRSSKDAGRLRLKMRDVTASLVALVGVNTSMSVHQESQTMKELLSEQQQKSNQMLSTVSRLVQLIEESPSTQAALTGSLGNFRQLTLQPASEADDTGGLIPRSKSLQPDENVPTSVLRVSKVQKATICTPHCACKCHRFRVIEPPMILSYVFGYGYVETAGSLFRKTQCDTLLCKAHAAPRVSVQYRLPQWLASRMIVMWLTSCPPCSPELLLRVPRVVDSENAAFKAIFSDVEAFELAITKGESTPYDVDEFGDTLFRCLMLCRAWDKLIHLSNYREYWIPSYIMAQDGPLVWKVLILDGASKRGISRPPLRDTMRTQISRLFDFDDYIEAQRFTRIHQIVCGLSNVSLEVALQIPSDIDTLDCEGRSALWYAVTYRRHDYVRILLERGADPNIGDPSFLKAVERHRSNLAITKALLNHGAVLGPFNKIRTLDWWADIRGPEVLAIDELLVKHGLDPNYRGDRGRTILMGVAHGLPNFVYPYRLKHLIELGSNIEIADEVGMTAIMYAVFFGFPSTFGILAHAGARVDVKATSGRTILHLAVWQRKSSSRKSISELCDLFRDVDLTKLDLDAKDGDRRSAFDLLRMRNGPNWEDYCAHVGIVWYGPRNEQELEDELEAISALENLLHYVQEVQGVPEADRYPPLGEYCSRIIEEEPVPGEWPMY